MNSVADIWANILVQLKQDLSETTIATWFDELEAADIRGNTFYLHCSNDFKKGYIESLFLKNIKSALRDIFSTDFEVSILDDDAFAEFKGPAAKKKEDRFTSEEFTFETFVVGPSNKLAYAASMAVAEHPAQNYNPLLIYGDSGLGKTHLLNSIANVIRRDDSRSKIVYIKGDDFINEFIELIRAGRGSEFRAKYRSADLLLVDVAPPDFETRVAIVKNKAAILGMNLPDKVAFTIAEKATANVRQLEGIVNKLLAYKDLLGDEASEDTVSRAIQDILKRSSEYIPTPEAILDYISKYYGVEESLIRGQQRVRDAVQARQIAMYLIRSMTNISVVDIGKVFDNRDHSTVLYSIQRVEDKMKRDPAYAERIKEIKTNISSKR